MTAHRGAGDGQGSSWPGVFGHRGGNLGPHNSVEAIRRAAEAGVDGVEIDIQIGPEGHPIAGHDLVAHGSARNEEQSGPGASGWTRLEDVLRAVEQAEVVLLIDFKSGGDPEREAMILAGALEDAARPDLILISSFSVPFLQQLQPLAPRFALYPIISLRQNFFRRIDWQRWAGASVLATALLVNPFLLRGLRRPDRSFFVWFAMTEWSALIKAAARLGARGVIVSEVARTVALLESAGSKA